MSDVTEYTVRVTLRAVKAKDPEGNDGVRVLAHLSVDGVELVGMSTLASELREPTDDNEVQGFLDAVRYEVREHLLYLLQDSEGAEP